jgi:phosphoribosyl 1,2-cyclic phosphodiesterase
MAAGVYVYMSLGTAEALRLSGHRLRVVEAGKQVQVGSWAVVPFEAVHDVEEPLNFLISGGREKLLYLTDTAYCPYRFIGLNVLMIECNYAADILQANVDRGALPEAMKRRVMKTHMGLDAVKGFLRANDLSQVREIHLIHLSDGNSDAERFKREVQAVTGKPVFVAER